MRHATAPLERPVAGEALLHPVVLLAIAVLFFNDQYGKALWPGVFTGKVSDVAGLAFFPLFLQAGVELAQQALGRRWQRSDRVLGCAVGMSALIFALIQFETPVTTLYRYGLGALQWPAYAFDAVARGAALPGLAPVRVWPDPTDLLTLPALWVAWRIGRVRPCAFGQNEPLTGSEQVEVPASHTW